MHSDISKGGPSNKGILSKAHARVLAPRVLSSVQARQGATCGHNITAGHVAAQAETMYMHLPRSNEQIPLRRLHPQTVVKEEPLFIEEDRPDDAIYPKKVGLLLVKEMDKELFDTEDSRLDMWKLERALRVD